MTRWQPGPYNAAMDEEARGLWQESYQGEVLGEVLFGLMAEREELAERRHQLEVLTLLERTTKELAEPVFEAGGADRGDTEATRAEAAQLAEAVTNMPWKQFLESIPAGTAAFQAKYRRMVELAESDAERLVAEAYVAHEQAFVDFARRALSDRPGDPLESILALPHVSAAVA